MVRYGFQFNKEKTAEEKLANELKAKARRLKALEEEENANNKDSKGLQDKERVGISQDLSGSITTTDSHKNKSATRKRKRKAKKVEGDSENG